MVTQAIRPVHQLLGRKVHFLYIGICKYMYCISRINAVFTRFIGSGVDFYAYG